MIKVKIPDAVMTSENPKPSEIFVKLNTRTESHERGHEGTECVEIDGQNPSNTKTPKRGNENQPAEDNSKPHLSDAVMTNENPKQSEIFMKFNMRIEIHHERGHEGTECVEADAQNPSNTQTTKRGSENQSAEDNSKPHHQSENVNSLKAKEEELKKEIFTLSTLMKQSAECCLSLKKENNKLLKDLKKKCSKDEISKLETMNPDGNSQSLDDESNSSMAIQMMMKEILIHSHPYKWKTNEQNL
ncbi:uncharacterized protein LOC129884492 isoform X2 [Solanum dulcamara]|uniref:uncharacterized protein LOC129884492 isoform X2 n=1 Tax=Solanum dulcamara TaxID=45834 RepID=UPI002485F42D|nr:uncharacterized protein LOC129884492 isoform X2 [Solanum dulcamara]